MDVGLDGRCRPSRGRLDHDPPCWRYWCSAVPLHQFTLRRVTTSTLSSWSELQSIKFVDLYERPCSSTVWLPHPDHATTLLRISRIHHATVDCLSVTPLSAEYQTKRTSMYATNTGRQGYRPLITSFTVSMWKWDKILFIQKQLNSKCYLLL